jgi:hypothetical protein
MDCQYASYDGWLSQRFQSAMAAGAGLVSNEGSERYGFPLFQSAQSRPFQRPSA